MIKVNIKGGRHTTAKGIPRYEYVPEMGSYALTNDMIGTMKQFTVLQNTNQHSLVLFRDLALVFLGENVTHYERP